MIRPNLLAWQWSDYAAKHRDRVNLLLHLVAVPLFQIGTLLLAAAALRRSGLGSGLALGCLVVAVVVEGRGHARELETPTPFSGPLDFASRFVVEQWVTFPRFVLSGAWSRGFRAR
ncbi:MAG: Mpo1-like protein [Candidatus Rokuibacteriota bacterium]|jgi:phage terminase small subunit